MLGCAQDEVLYVCIAILYKLYKVFVLQLVAAHTSTLK